MGKDWYEPRDTSPPIEEPNRHRKRGGGKKPFILEYRYVGPKRGFLARYYEEKREWSVYQRYKTAKGREQALHSLSRREGITRRWWEYRIPPDA